MERLRIGSRGSNLALRQSQQIQAWLESHGRAAEIVVIRTKGDATQDQDHFPKEPGLFIKAIETALERGEVDLAVHSLKDMPSQTAVGMMLPAFSHRENPCDVLCCSDEAMAQKLSHAVAESSHGSSQLVCRIATSSPRRQALLRRRFPNGKVLPMRGNVETRLSKLGLGEMDATVLARAGLNRLGIDRPTFIDLPVEWMVPAAGQGIVVVECRENDKKLGEFLRGMNDATSETAALTERAFMARLGGGCQSAVGVHAWLNGGRLEAVAQVLSLDGIGLVEARRIGDARTAVQLGEQLADDCVQQGAAELLAEH